MRSTSGSSPLLTAIWSRRSEKAPLEAISFRLNVLPVVIPPLRKRKDDILVLLQYFWAVISKTSPPKDLTLLSKYDWPGNIRELENVATYYKTLLSLPEYITEQRFTDAAFTTEVEIQETVLKLIYSNTALSHGIGNVQPASAVGAERHQHQRWKLPNILDQMQTAGSSKLVKVGMKRESQKRESFTYILLTNNL